MREWLKYSNHQLALFVWSTWLYCLYPMWCIAMIDSPKIRAEK
jgi:hypothetical protein